jgi:drug/metabolite transporter (DMT)-like permease
MIRRHYGAQPNQAGFVVALFAAAFLLGSSFIAGKMLLNDGFPSLILVGHRFLVAAVATLPLVLLEGEFHKALLPRAAGVREACVTVLIGLLQTSAVMGLLFLALNTITASTAAILLFTNPIWVALLGRLVFGEALSARRATGLVLGIIGVGFAIGISPDLLSGGKVKGELLALSSSLCWAIATIINKRATLPFGPWALSFWQMLIGSLGLLGLAYGFGEHWPATASVTQWGWFLWLAIPASTGSFGLWFVALGKGGATRASSFLFLAPLFTVILSFFILSAPMSLGQALGGGMIGAALWLVNRNA